MSYRCYMSVTRLAKLSARVRRLEREVRRIKEVLELTKPFNPFDWEELSPLEKEIFRHLLKRGWKGDTATNMAKLFGVPNPETSGRVKVYRKLRRIEKISMKKEGVPIVVLEGKRWLANFTEYDFEELLNSYMQNKENTK